MALREELQVRRTAQRILAGHLRPGRGAPLIPFFPEPDVDLIGPYWGERDVDLTDATLIDFDMGACHLRRATFVGATFHGAAEFRSTTFTGHASFDAATFHGKAEFFAATFHGEARFVAATFHGVSPWHARVLRPDREHSWPPGWTVRPDGDQGRLTKAPSGGVRSRGVWAIPPQIPTLGP